MPAFSEVVSLPARRRFQQRPSASALLMGCEDGRHGRCHSSGEDILHFRSNVGPKVAAAFCIDELCRDPDAIGGFANAALQHVTDPKVTPGFADIDRLARNSNCGQ